MLTRVFKSGNSMAVRIPKVLGLVDAAQEVEVVRVGDTLVLRLLGQETLADIGEIFAMFSPGFMAEGREFHEERERDWSGTTSTSNSKAARGMNHALHARHQHLHLPDQATPATGLAPPAGVDPR